MVVKEQERDKSSTTNYIENFYSPEYDEWFRLDNAAVIFSLISSPTVPAVFRLSVTLKEIVNVTKLQEAVNMTIPRFPYFRVNLKPGLFWYYWRMNRGYPQVIGDDQYHSQEMPIRKKGIFPFRIRTRNKNIAVEFHHVITDGTGALTFLKALVAKYLELQGKRIQAPEIFCPEDHPNLEEYEDAYKKYFNNLVPPIPRYSRAYQLPFQRIKRIFYIITGIVPINDIKSVSQEYQVTITELLVTVYLEALQSVMMKQQGRKKLRPIRVSVPVNLRNLFPSKTLRNFSLHVMVEIDPRLGKHSFEEILNDVHHQMKLELKGKAMQKQIKRNVAAEIHPLMRITPLFLKRIFGMLIYNLYGEKQFSGSLTNLGLIKLPTSMEDKIDEIHFIPSANATRKVGCAVGGYKDKLYINFGRVCNEKEVEKFFFRKLASLGIRVKVRTNEK